MKTVAGGHDRQRQDADELELHSFRSRPAHYVTIWRQLPTPATADLSAAVASRAGRLAGEGAMAADRQQSR